jgi:hypothetical protein
LIFSFFQRLGDELLFLGCGFRHLEFVEKVLYRIVIVLRTVTACFSGRIQSNISTFLFLVCARAHARLRT